MAEITNLPVAALPVGDSTSDVCALTDRLSLINRVESEGPSYNLSLLVNTCSSVCLLVYGAENPDISGIGVCSLGCFQLRCIYLI